MWFQLQTFNVGGPQSNVEDLTDGVAMAQALHQMYVLCHTEIYMYLSISAIKYMY